MATISPLHGFSALSTLEMNPTPNFNLYFNYGGDYIARDYGAQRHHAELATATTQPTCLAA